MQGPLEGIRVLDFGQYLAGPFGPMLLADLGADVIKVEPTRGDGMRGGFIGPFMGCQRGKRDVALDLKQPDGLRLALELVGTADIVHHNMTLGTADRLGIGYEHCKAVRPDILYCNTYMYGPVGPLAQQGGVDPLAQAAAGLEWEQGPVAEGNPPLWYRYGHGDVAAAIPSVSALLIALYHRNRTGEGQSMWASLLHGAMLYTADSWLAADGTPSPRPTLDREQLGLDALYRLYETQDGWLQLAAVRDEHWPALCRVLRREELVDDSRFATAADRKQRRSELTALLADAFMADLATQLAACAPIRRRAGGDLGRHLGRRDHPLRRRTDAPRPRRRVRSIRCSAGCANSATSSRSATHPDARSGRRRWPASTPARSWPSSATTTRRSTTTTPGEVVTWPGDDYPFGV